MVHAFNILNFEKTIGDKWWRLNNLYKIKDKFGKMVQFILNSAQTSFYYGRHNLDIILKARQLGFTTFFCIDYLDDCLFMSNMSAGIIAHNLEDAKSFFEDKIKFAYDNLPDAIKKLRPANTEKKGELRFNNGSKIRVSSSFRSGTLQRLLISEFGKICAKHPHKAKEIVTGALNAVAVGNRVAIESTAEGKAGYFYQYCETAKQKKARGEVLGQMDYKLHFFPWYEDPAYKIDATGVVFTQQNLDYFAKLESDYGIILTPEQRAWYSKKEESQGEDMKKEFPSYPDEAFEQAIEGAYYAKQFALADKERRITHVPHEPLLKVHTAWDLGMNDSNGIWFFQEESSGIRRYIDYYENSGEPLSHYVKVMADKKEYVYGKTILPHDARVRSLNDGKTRVEILEGLGLKDIEIVDTPDLNDAIESVRNFFKKCWFDQTKCALGINHLRMYRKAWDDKAGCWKDHPVHGPESHGADAFRMSVGVSCKEIVIPQQTTARNKYR
nr:terminase [Bacteriovorax sp. HI3]